MDIDLFLAALLIVGGGLFGWVLGQLPRHWVYATMAVFLVLALVVITRNTGDGVQ